MTKNIVNRIFSFIGADSKPISDRDLLLKQTLKELGQNKYAKFYRPKTDEIDPSFAQYLFCFYKTIYPARSFLKNEAKIKKLKQICFEHSLSAEVLATVRRLSPEVIEAQAQETTPNELIRRLQDDFIALSNTFDNERIKAINRCYNLIMAFSRLAFFDYAAFLQNFDSTLRDGVFTVPPKFTALNVGPLVRDLGIFYTAISAPASGDDWAAVFTVMRIANDGTDVLPPSQWNMLLANMKELTSSKILEIMVRLSSKNLLRNGKVIIPDEHLCENWFEKKREEIRQHISEIADKQRNTRIQALAKAVFEKPELERLNYYTGTDNKVYTQKGMNGFVYAAGLNYLTAFIQDYVKKDIQEICDLVLIRGQWNSNNASLQMSDAFHKILEFLPPIEALDASLSEEGITGLRLRGALFRVDLDKTQARNINNITETIDEEALKLINGAVQNLIVVGKHLKALVDDIVKKEPELIINWKKVDGHSKSPIARWLSDTYKKLNYFVQLMTLVIHPAE